MAIVIKRGDTLHIQWYDTAKKRTTSKSTRLKATVENWRIAKKYAKEFQNELSIETAKIKSNSLRENNLGEAIEHFMQVNSGKARKTIKDYKRFTNYFVEHFSESEPVSAITKISYEQWLLKIRELNQAQNSKHGLSRQGSHFLNFLFEYEYINIFKVNKNLKIGPEVKEVITYSEDELTIVFSNLEEKTDNFQTILHTLYYSGLRSKDILTLEVKNIDLKKKMMKYYDNKRKIWRTVPIHKKLKPILKLRIKEVIRGKLFGYSSEDSVGRAIKRYYKKIGIDGRGLSARIFRKTFMTKLRILGVDKSIIQELVGHKHTDVIDIHYTDFQSKSMRKALNKYPSLN